MLISGSVTTAFVQDLASTPTWVGTGGDSLYNGGANWSDGNGSTLRYGNLNFGSSTTNPTVDVDSTNLARHEVFFVSARNYTLTDNGFTFYDDSGYPSRIENDARGTGTVNVSLKWVVRPWMAR